MFTHKKFFLPVLLVLVAFIPVLNVNAHVVVRPDQAKVASYQTFTISVPNERDVPTTALRLVVPDEIQSVTPNVKPGWQISIESDDSGKTKEVSWIGGSIPVKQRDEFIFSTKTPASETTLKWKAYQTYKDGVVVTWDTDPATLSHDDDKDEDESKPKPGPYSSTKIVNDLSPAATTSSNSSDESKVKEALSWAYTATGISVLSFLLSVYTLTRPVKVKKETKKK